MVTLIYNPEFGKMRQENYEFRASLSYIRNFQDHRVKPCLKERRKKKGQKEESF